LVDDDVSAGRPEGDADRVGELLGAREELLAGVVGVEELLGHYGCLRFVFVFGAAERRQLLARGASPWSCPRPVIRKPRRGDRNGPAVSSCLSPLRGFFPSASPPGACAPG